ncbi:MAG: hypothetical protein ACR2KP_00325, partial [Egibacteraceae bacterium]
MTRLDFSSTAPVSREPAFDDDPGDDGDGDGERAEDVHLAAQAIRRLPRDDQPDDLQRAHDVIPSTGSVPASSSA